VCHSERSEKRAGAREAGARNLDCECHSERSAKRAGAREAGARNLHILVFRTSKLRNSVGADSSTSLGMTLRHVFNTIFSQLSSLSLKILYPSAASSSFI
jgi:hypothetical protein